MAIADLVTRLLLENKQFDDALKESKKQVKDFEGGIKNIVGGVKSSFLAFAGAAGIAVGGVEAFKSIIFSTQDTGDAFQKVMDQAKASVDAFFASVAMGDMGNFISNLNNVIEKAGTLSMMADELATKQLYTDRDLSKLTTQMQIELNLAKDRTKSEKERNQHLEKSRELQVKINALTRSLANQQQKTGYQTIRTEMAKQGYRHELPDNMIDSMFSEENRGKLTEFANKYKELKQAAEDAEYALSNSTKVTRSGFVINNGSVGELSRQYMEATKAFKDYMKTSEGLYAERAHFFCNCLMTENRH
jgi:hypothetical protein